jgi:hypothetical protein
LLDFSWCNIPKREKYTKITIKYIKWQIKYTKRQQNRPNGYKIYQHLPLQDHLKFTQSGIFSFEIMQSGNPAAEHYFPRKNET